MMQRLPVASLALAVLFLGAWCLAVPVSAQDKPGEDSGKSETAPDEGSEEAGKNANDADGKEGSGGGSTLEAANPPESDGHDRPTTYPRIRFGGKKDGENDREAEDAEPELKSRVYLLDVSDSMSKSITIDGTRETTRLDHMIAQVERSLDSLATRGDPSLRFNIVTFGTVDDFAEGGELQSATPASVKRAKKWLSELMARGKSDMYGMLKECFEQEPDSATMIVGAKPTWPDGVGEEDKAEHKDAGEYLLAEVKKWRAEGKKTTLDITGVGLSEDEVKYFKRLAEAAGGTYLDA